jgi:hypothetical protein
LFGRLDPEMKKKLEMISLAGRGPKKKKDLGRKRSRETPKLTHFQPASLGSVKRTDFGRCLGGA